MTTDTLINPNDPLWEVLLRLLINTATLFIIIRLIYNRFSDNRKNLFSFFLMGIMIFMVCILLKNVEMQMGMVLGLFAIFSIMRYRTKNIAFKDMAYLFTVIGISAINALLDYPKPVRGTILVNSILIVTIFLLEISFVKTKIKGDITEEEKKKELSAEELEKKEAKKEQKRFKKDNPLKQHKILYDKLELLSPDKWNDLKTDVSIRTGIKIEKIRICKINLVADNAELDVFYHYQKHKPEVNPTT